MIGKRLVAIALAGAMCLAVPAAYAGLEIKSVDTGSFPVLRVSVLTSEPSSQAPKLRENGRPVRIQRAENLAAEKSVVLAIDRSQSMRGAPLAMLTGPSIGSGSSIARTFALATSRTCTKSRNCRPSSRICGARPAARALRKMLATPAYRVSLGMRGP